MGSPSSAETVMEQFRPTSSGAKETELGTAPARGLNSALLCPTSRINARRMPPERRAAGSVAVRPFALDETTWVTNETVFA
jgi:hypothetical protein